MLRATGLVSIEHLIADASRGTTLLPGDVLLTGTPAGVGVAQGQFLLPATP